MIRHVIFKRLFGWFSFQYGITKILFTVTARLTNESYAYWRTINKYVCRCRKRKWKPILHSKKGNISKTVVLFVFRPRKYCCMYTTSLPFCSMLHKHHLTTAQQCLFTIQTKWIMTHHPLPWKLCIFWDSLLLECLVSAKYVNDTNPASPSFFFYRQFWNDCIKLDPLTDDKNENALIKIANIELVIEFFSFKKNVSPSGLLLEL